METKGFIVVTGATKGIGRAIIMKFAKHGFNVAFCSRNKQNVDSLIEELKVNYPSIKVIGCQVDMSIKNEVIGFANYLLDKNILPEVIVNNAGIFIPGLLIEEADGMLEKQIETNLYSAYYFTRMFVNALKERQSGQIFNVCSTASLQAYTNGGSYSISKFALLGFNKGLRLELMPYNIKVTAILPGATFTDSWSGTDLPESRFMKAEDIAEIVFSSSQLSSSACVEEILIRPILGDI